MGVTFLHEIKAAVPARPPPTESAPLIFALSPPRPTPGRAQPFKGKRLDRPTTAGQSRSLPSEGKIRVDPLCGLQPQSASERVALEMRGCQDVHVPIGNYLRGRSLAQWLVGGFIAALGISALVWGTVKTVQAVEMRSQGVQTTAVVESVMKQGKSSDYLVEYTLRDGTPYAAWIGDLPSGTGDGDSVTVVYLPGSPGTIDTPFALSRWWVTLLAAPFGVFFIWFGWVCWSSTPESFMRMLRHRYGG